MSIQPSSLAQIAEYVRQLVISAFPEETEKAGLDDDADLFDLLDSLGILRVLIDVERSFNLKIPNSESTPENVGTVRLIAEFIARKQGSAVGLPA